MKLKMSMIDAKNFTPLAENEYTKNIFRTDERGYFQTYIYFRNSKNKIYLPAFSFEENLDGEISLAFGANEHDFKILRRVKNFFCDTSAENSLGWGVAGRTYIFILKDGKIFERHELLILPDNIEGAAMISELLFIRRELFHRYNEINFYENLREKSWDEILKYLNSQAEEIFRLMKNVDNRPRFALQKILQSCDVSKIRRFDNKFFKQYFTAPDRKKYLVSVDKVSMNIFENRLLKNKLSRLKNFIEVQTLQQKIRAESLQQNILAQIYQTRKLNAENKSLAENMRQNLYSQLQKVTKILDASANKILKTLNACLNLKVFSDADNKNENWRMTQIFTNDENYRRAYQKLKELDEFLDFSFDADEKFFPAEKMYQIYEWWTLAKILEFLVIKLNWQCDETPVKIFGDIENLQNTKIFLTHENLTMEIFYNTEINESLQTTNCNLRPDFLFKVTAGDTEKIFILDAKYRNYKQQGFKFWLEKDLYGVCYEKYIREIENFTGKKISASFIVHSDKTSDAEKFLGKYVVFNGNLLFENFLELDGAAQQTGAFYLLPQIDDNFNQSEINLSLFFKLMLEYFMKEWKTCWECGSSEVEIEEKITRGGREKFYLHCKNCGAFWVKSHCGNCENDLLIKHAINYHIEKAGTWLVCCPKCGG